MTLWCLLKALGMSTWEILRRIPYVIWFVVVLVILPVLVSLIVSGILWLMVVVVVMARSGNPFIVLSGFFGGFVIMMFMYVTLSHTIISGQDFNRWLKHMDLPCNDESFSRYMDFKREHRLGLMGDVMQFKFATCKHDLYTEKEDVRC